ncbi:MAG: DUF2291 domain-containing protein [Lachnospiraceae bacterium]
MKKKIVSLVLVCAMAMTLMSGCIKVVKIGEEGELTGETEFNAGDNVAEFWESEALPELKDEAVDLAEFLAEAKGDLNSLADQYGTYSMGTSGELSYTVKGTGTVEAVDTESQAGTMTIKLNDYSGAEEVKIQIGNVIKGSSIRDSLSFIKFGDYTNQQDYAAVSQSINEIVLEDVINPDSAKDLEGKTITFLGCFTVSDNITVLITPVELTEE